MPFVQQFLFSDLIHKKPSEMFTNSVYSSIIYKCKKLEITKITNKSDQCYIVLYFLNVRHQYCDFIVFFMIFEKSHNVSKKPRCKIIFTVRSQLQKTMHIYDQNKVHSGYLVESGSFLSCCSYSSVFCKSATTKMDHQSETRTGFLMSLCLRALFPINLTPELLFKPSVSPSGHC